MTKTCEGGSGRRTTNPPPGEYQTIKLSPGKTKKSLRLFFFQSEAVHLHNANETRWWVESDSGVYINCIFILCWKNFISLVQPCGLHKASVWHKLCGDIEGRAIASSSYLTSFVMERKNSESGEYDFKFQVQIHANCRIRRVYFSDRWFLLPFVI